MSKSYLSIPLSLRLKAYRLNGKKQLGHHWFDEPGTAENKWKGKGYHAVPTSTCNPDGCWGGAPWQIDKRGTEFRWVENLSHYFRNITPSHDIIKLNHTGWFTDNDNNETCHGLVLQLPARDGKEIYLCGVNDPNNDDAGFVAFRKCEWADNKEDAARWADRMAERYAESEREHDAKFHAEQDIEQARERIVAIRLDLRSLITSTRESVLKPRVCEAVRDQMKSLREESHELWKEITERQDNYWSAVER